MAIMGLPGYMEMLIWASLLSLMMVILTKFLTDQNLIKNIKKEMKILNDKIKRAQKEGKTGDVSKHTNEMLKLSSKQMRQSLKPMIFSFGIFIVAIWFFGMYYADLIVTAPFTVPFIGKELNWFWWYFFIVFGTNFLFRKLLEVV